MASYVYFNGDKIKAKALKEVNKVVNTEITVGDISISVFKRFPKTSLVLTNVKITDPVQKERYLCKGATLYLDFNSIDLIFGDYTLDRIGLDADFVRLVKHPEQWNYIIWKQTKTNNSNFKIKLKSIDWDVDSIYLKNDDVYVESQSSGQLNFVDSLFSATASIDFATVAAKGKTYKIPKSEFEIENFNGTLVQFSKASISNAFVEVTAVHEQDDWYGFKGVCKNISALGKSVSLNNLPAFIGNIAFDFSADINKLDAPKKIHVAATNVSWKAQKLDNISGDIQAPDINTLNSLTFNLSGDYDGNKVTIKSSDAKLNNGKRAIDIQSGAISFALDNDNITLGANQIKAKISVPKIIDFIQDFQINKIDVIEADIEGFQYKMNTLSQNLFAEGFVTIRDNDVKFKSTKATINGSEIKVDAGLPSIKSLLASPTQLLLQLDIRGDEVQLNAIETPDKTDSVAVSTSGSTDLDFNIAIQFDFKQLTYDKIKAVDTYGSLLIRPTNVDINSFTTTVFDGKLYTTGSYSIASEKLSLTGFANEISAENLLRSFNNFNQNYVSYTNCKGKADLRFELNDVAFWNDDWGHSKIYLELYKAELKNLPFLADIKAAIKQNRFAKFILNEDELFQKLSFINLQEAKANFTLTNKKVTVSDAIFRSPEINLNSKGEYNVGADEVDFEFQLFIKDFFAKSTTESSYYLPDRKGTKLSFYLSGKADNPDVGLLKRSKTEKEESDFNIKSIFTKDPETKTNKDSKPIFIIDNEKESEDPEKEEKKKKGWFKKLLEKGEAIGDTTKVKFGVE